jgi:Ran GTPase-activating protein (RanGAP) involved in mRNA processing and transport
MGYGTYNADGVKAIADSIAVTTSVTSVGKDGLNLKDNRLGDEGWGAIFAAVCSSKASKVTSIDASSEAIGIKGAKLIGQALRNSVNTSLTHLLMGENSMEDESCIALAEGMQQNGSCKIEALNLCGNKIGPPGAKSLAAMISVTASLTRVDVRGNYLGQEGKAVLRKAVEGRSGLQLLL